MQRITFSGLATVIVAGLFLAGCASNTLKPDEQSGFLKDYSDVKATKDATGTPFFRYVSPNFTPANYNALIVKPVEFYPKPQATDQVSQATLDEVLNYISEKLHDTLSEHVKVVDSPGPGVATVAVALTAVAPQNVALKEYQYIPVALVLTAGKRALTGTPEEAKLVVEGRITDSVTDEILLKVVRIGTGEELKKIGGTRQLTLDDLKPLIDKWAEGVADSAKAYVKSK